MKKIKLLTPLLASISLSGCLPLTALSSCGQTTTETVTCSDKSQTLTGKYVTYTINLRDDLKSEDIAEPIFSSNEIRWWDYYIRDKKLILKVELANFINNSADYEIKFDVTINKADGSLYGVVKDLVFAYDKTAFNLVAGAVAEFLEIAKVPRPSHYNQKIREYIMARARALGYEPQTDLDTTADPETDPANVWFDVPASDGYENHKGIILQGHMDMVIAGMTKEEAKTTPIEVEYHENNHTLTSKDKKTSLGADNGIGVGMIFALLQQKEIKHGPLRILFTADEEDGMLGAKRLTLGESHVLTDFDYLISLDGELDRDGYYRSCQGSLGYTYNHTFDNLDTITSPIYNVFVKGFKGGHSGNDINKGRCSATVFLLSVLDALEDESLQIQKYNHEVYDPITRQMKDTPPSRTSIPSIGRVYFKSSKSKDQITEAFNKTKEKFAAKYTGESWDDVKLEIETSTPAPSAKVLTVEDTQKVISLITNNKSNGLEYGPYIVDEKTNRPLLSNNIAPLAITPSEDGNTTKFSLKTYCRSTTTENILKWQEKFPQIWSNFYDDELAFPDVYFPWEINENDQIQKMAHQGYEEIGIDPYIRDTNGGVEPCLFCYKNPNLQQTCLGTKFEGVHSVNETCYLDPLVNTVKVLRYIFDNLK